MSVTEAERAALRTALTEEIGEDPADSPIGPTPMSSNGRSVV